MLDTAGARRRGGNAPYALPTSAPWNAPLPAAIPSPDGYDSAIHPGVVDMGTPWHGFRFWMGNTSYYNGNSLWEDPYVVASHDGYHWVNPPGITNPIQNKPPDNYHSDTDLLYDPVADQLICMFRLGFGPRIMRSSDGVTWTGPETWTWPISGGPVSPSMVRIAADEWWVYAVDANASPLRVLLYKSTTPTGPWTWQSLGVCMTDDARGPWHIDVMRDSGGVFRALAQAGQNTAPQAIWAASSLDGVTWSNSAAPVIEVSAAGGWDDYALYRPTLTEHEDGVHFRVWYGGRQNGPLWLTGYTQIARSEWPDPPAAGI